MPSVFKQHSHNEKTLRSWHIIYFPYCFHHSHLKTFDLEEVLLEKSKAYDNVHKQSQKHSGAQGCSHLLFEISKVFGMVLAFRMAASTLDNFGVVSIWWHKPPQFWILEQTAVEWENPQSMATTTGKHPLMRGESDEKEEIARFSHTLAFTKRGRDRHIWRQCWGRTGAAI